MVKKFFRHTVLNQKILVPSFTQLRIQQFEGKIDFRLIGLRHSV